MDWDKLRIFHAVADAGSFTHAGHELNLSQSAVSRQIQQMEAALGVPLFERRHRSLALGMSPRSCLALQRCSRAFAAAKGREYVVPDDLKTLAGPVLEHRLIVTPEAALTRGEDGLFRASEGDLTADATARVQSAALEGSNVSPVETMVAMISAARQFETQMKMLQTAEANEKASAQLLSMNG